MPPGSSPSPLGPQNDSCRAAVAVANQRASQLIRLGSGAETTCSSTSTAFENTGRSAGSSEAGGTQLGLCEPPAAEPEEAAVCERQSSARLSKVGNNQLCTEAMLHVLQQDILKERRCSVNAFDDLEIDSMVGRGGYGSVYRGLWHGSPAAVKIMDARRSNSEAVSDAMEMAVLSSVQHPNIVQVFCCLTDMVRLDDGEPPLPLGVGRCVVAWGVEDWVAP
jgi:hypothetical protein